MYSRVQICYVKCVAFFLEYGADESTRKTDLVNVYTAPRWGLSVVNAQPHEMWAAWIRNNVNETEICLETNN